MCLGEAIRRENAPMRRVDQGETVTGPESPAPVAQELCVPPQGASWRLRSVGDHARAFRQSESAGVPGRHITGRQMRLFMTLKKTHNTETAAAKSGFGCATGFIGRPSDSASDSLYREFFHWVLTPSPQATRGRDSDALGASPGRGGARLRPSTRSETVPISVSSDNSEEGAARLRRGDQGAISPRLRHTRAGICLT